MEMSRHGDDRTVEQRTGRCEFMRDADLRSTGGRLLLARLAVGLSVAFVVVISVGGCSNDSGGGQRSSSDESPTAAPQRSDCAAVAIACYDEFANQPVGMINFRPRSRWPRTNLTWRLVEPLGGIPEAAQVDTIRRAFAEWASVSRLMFRQTDSQDSDITVQFVSGDHGDPFPLCGEATTLAHAFFPGTESAGDIHLCRAEPWSLQPVDGRFDLFTVTIHEIGHALGLEHSLDASAVMAPGYEPAGFSRLAAADVRAVRMLYGSRDGRRPPMAARRPGRLGAAPELLTLNDPDSDGDGIPDTLEIFVLGTDPFLADTDGDGADDFEEVFRRGTPAAIGRPGEVDSDDDGLPDSLERDRGTDPESADTDSDGLTDEEELFFYGTDPLVSDTDADGVNDSTEVFALDTDPFNPDSDFDGLLDGADSDPLEPLDSDGDSLPDAAETFFFGTDPQDPDTDDDGVIDGDEIHFLNTDPLTPDAFDDDATMDSDGDGLPDRFEVTTFKTDPSDDDSDGDGLSDGDEFFDATDPNNVDTDDDGLTDGDEILVYDTDPNDRDSDGDGLSDGAEVNIFATDPNDPDSDGDDVLDGDEVRAGTNPLQPKLTFRRAGTPSGQAQRTGSETVRTRNGRP